MFKELINRIRNGKVEKIVPQEVKKEDDSKIILTKNDDVLKMTIIGTPSLHTFFEKVNELYLSYKILFVDKYPRGNNDSLNLKTCKNLINHSENYIYKIKVGNKEAIGFFCKIPIPKKDNMLSILITNNNILNNEILNKEDEKIIIINIKEEKEIKLSHRRKYISKEYNITIIEVKKEDKIDNYLELDEKIIDDILNIKERSDEYISNIFCWESFYMIGISKIEIGSIRNCRLDLKRFDFHCNKKDQKQGTPIFTTRKSKLVGLFDYANHINLGFGIFLNYPIKEFIRTNYK